MAFIASPMYRIQTIVPPAAGTGSIDGEQPMQLARRRVTPHLARIPTFLLLSKPATTPLLPITIIVFIITSTVLAHSITNPHPV